MAQLHNSITGKITGSSGNLIFYKRFGKNCVRRKPEHINDANSDAQKIQRSKLTISQEYLRMVEEVIHISYREPKPKRTQFNAAMSYLMLHSFEQVDGEWKLIPSKIKNAKGSLFSCHKLVVIDSGDQVLNYTWSINESVGFYNLNDTFCFVLYNITKKEVQYAFTPQKRSDMSCTVYSPNEWSGDQIAVYGFFLSENHKTVSNDTYITTLCLQ